MNNSTRKKKEQLGINPSTASSTLKKILLFDFAKKLELDTCYHCGKKIDTIDEFSIEHKEPWLDSDDPVGLFFDLNNIAFSHFLCNSRHGANKMSTNERIKRKIKTVKSWKEKMDSTVIDGKKKCVKCEKVKKLSEFPIDKTRIIGIKGRCKECHREGWRERQKKHRSKTSS